jgi:hypothetical protein
MLRVAAVLSLAAAVAVAPPERAEAGEGTAPQTESYVPALTLPRGGGGARQGEGGSQRGEAEREGVSAARLGATKDLPQWLGEETGWWSMPPPEEAAQQTRHVTWAPFITTSPQIGVGFGVAAAGTQQLGDPATTRLSKFATNLLVTTENQYSIPLRTNFNLPGGDWNLVGLFRWSKWPSPSWGIGGNTPDSAKTTIDYQLLRFYEVVNRRLGEGFYLGAGYRLDYYWNVRDQAAGTGQVTDFQQYPYGTGSQSLNSSLVANVLWDTRDSPVFATRGLYANLSYAFTPSFLGSDTTWQTFYADVRGYYQLTRPLVLGLWSYAWMNFGQVPYLELPSIGSDPDARSGRGYTEGRHIGKALLYAEAELRWTIWEWAGVVAGVNLHSVSERDPVTGALPDGPNFKYVWPSFVIGARILVEKATTSNLCVDFAFGRIGQKGVYINFAEAF